MENFTAEDAKSISKSYCELTEILKNIKEKAKQGEYNLGVTANLKEDIVNKIKEKGFKIEDSPMASMIVRHTISWA
jgi:hypothetical protein